MEMATSAETVLDSRVGKIRVSSEKQKIEKFRAKFLGKDQETSRRQRNELAVELRKNKREGMNHFSFQTFH